MRPPAAPSPGKRSPFYAIVNTGGMLEKRKDDSEAVGKYSSMLMAAIIGALVLFLAPILVAYITGVDDIFAPPDDANLPAEIEDKINEIFQVVLWLARIIVVMFIVLAVILLRVRAPLR